MAIRSSGTGALRLDGEDASAFRRQIEDGPNPAAMAAVSRGLAMAETMRKTGRVSFAVTAPALWTEHRSREDASINWTAPTPDGGMLECRYVRRVEEYFIAYLSSHSGCRLTCRFCHLTQTGQTMFRPSSIEDLTRQLDQVLGHYDQAGAPARRMNVNFMARGEPLANAGLMSSFGAFASHAAEAAGRRGLEHRLNLSTIFPAEAREVDLASAFGEAPVTLFWSLYSLDPSFRRRWLPRAEAPERVMDRLLDWQARAQGEVVLHWALIEGQNDRDEDLEEIAGFVRRSGLRARLNLVRYNPHSTKTGREAEEDRYEAALATIGREMSVPGSRVVPRVGFDVKASCGMFLENTSR